MIHAINLLETQIRENKAKLKDMAQRKEELTEELTQLHLSQGNLKGSTDMMESELKGLYYTESTKWGSKDYPGTQDQCASVSMNKPSPDIGQGSDQVSYYKQ